MSIIQVKNLNYSIGKDKILKNINMQIEECSIIGIIGTNGSGKTSLLKMLSGRISNHNSVIFNYAYVDSKKNKADFIKIGSSFVDDKFLFEDCYHELLFPLENLLYDPDIIRVTIKDLVNYFDCSYILDKKICDLKEYEKSILRILLSLINKPKLVILDNPFKSMNMSIRNKFIMKLIKYVRDNSITLIFSSSLASDIMYTDYTYVLDDGNIVMEGNTIDVLEEDVNLKKIGIDLPFAIDLSLMLKFYEILDNIYLDIEGVVDQLWK